MLPSRKNTRGAICKCDAQNKKQKGPTIYFADPFCFLCFKSLCLLLVFLCLKLQLFFQFLFCCISTLFFQCDGVCLCYSSRFGFLLR